MTPTVLTKEEKIATNLPGDSVAAPPTSDFPSTRRPIDQTPLSIADRLRIGLGLRLLRFKEWLSHDSFLVRRTIGLAGALVAFALGCIRKSASQFNLLCRLHRGDFHPWASAQAEHLVRQAVSGQKPEHSGILSNHISRINHSLVTKNFTNQPELLIGTPSIVLKSPRGKEKGLLLAHYNYIFPLLAHYYDLNKIAERYHIVLEPSWRGYCDLDLLCYSCFKFPVFIQTVEPRDAHFLTCVGTNYIQIPTGGNWWVDHRVFHPRPQIEKRFDVVMLAVWADYKRHHCFFSALSRLRRNGHRLQVLLVGGGAGPKRDEIERQIQYYGLVDQVELQGGVAYEAVNALVNQAKIHVLWSRKEGFPRAVIETMFAGLPNIVREGFNYGHRYSYINQATGAFATEDSLPRTLLDTVARAPEMTPREWALKHISCQRATDILSCTIRDWCERHDQPWTTAPTVKVTRLHELRYWDEGDRNRFAADYEFLKGSLRSGL